MNDKKIIDNLQKQNELIMAQNKFFFEKMQEMMSKKTSDFQIQGEGELSANNI